MDIVGSKERWCMYSSACITFSSSPEIASEKEKVREVLLRVTPWNNTNTHAMWKYEIKTLNEEQYLYSCYYTSASILQSICHMIFRNYYNMLICCSRYIYNYILMNVWIHNEYHNPRYYLSMYIAHLYTKQYCIISLYTCPCSTDAVITAQIYLEQ